ncbi:hypothetical protein K0M31_015391, partial [Melipona bicolor]
TSRSPSASDHERLIAIVDIQSPILPKRFHGSLRISKRLRPALLGQLAEMPCAEGDTMDSTSRATGVEFSLHTGRA